ncbi:MAG: septum formation protein Maf [Alphaproteobacteria bacterium]|nr:septum formation protein Maf [Alphaproteobacteria bacterium]
MISELSRPLILASSSSSRATILRDAGLVFDAVPARIDETALIESLGVENARPRGIADALAEAKTRKVATAAPPDALVIGADQLLVCDGRIFEKPRDRTEAVAHLRFLSGKTHELVGAVCGAANGAVVWRHVATARLTMRSMDDAFISDYLDQAGPGVMTSVGCYQLEGLGVHLMTRIDGDYFAILGLPLLAVLDFLRSQGALRA